MRRHLSRVFVLSVALLAGCDLVGVQGSGTVIREAREVSGFTVIVLQGGGQATIEVSGEDSLTIAAEDNLMPLLTSDVEDGVLELGATEAISPTRDIVYTITVAGLDGVSVLGSGTIGASDVDGGEFEVAVSGSGMVSISNLTSDELVVRISGSGNAELAGSANHLELDVSGSGDYLGEDLVSTTAAVSVSGSGNALVNVNEDLEAEVSGAGNVVYLGNPAWVDSALSGSGEIEKG